MQKGLATLEIIFAVMIIGVLMKFAVPKASALIDAATLNHETKRFYSELRFVQAMGRSTSEVITGNSPPAFFINRTENYYQVFKDMNINKPIREPHYFSDGVTIKSVNNTDPTITINFDSEGKAKIRYNSTGLSRNSDTLELTSRLGKNKYIRIDSVGRILGSPNKYE